MSSSIYVSVKTVLMTLPQATDEEMGLKICVKDCLDRLVHYQSTMGILFCRPTRGILSLCRQMLVDLLFFIDPQANSQLGMAMELMEIPYEQIHQINPEEKIPWCQVAWILLWIVHGVQRRGEHKVFLIL